MKNKSRKVRKSKLRTLKNKKIKGGSGLTGFFGNCSLMGYRYKKIFNDIKQQLYDYIDSLGRYFVIYSPTDILEGALLFLRRNPRFEAYKSFIVIDTSKEGIFTKEIIYILIRRLQSKVRTQILTGNTERVHEIIDFYVDTEFESFCAKGGERYLRELIRERHGEGTQMERIHLGYSKW